MGYLTDGTHSYFKTREERDGFALQNNMQYANHNYMAIAGVQLGSLLIQKGTSFIGNKLNGSDKSETPTNNEQLKVYEYDLEKCLKAIGASDKDDINEAVSRVQQDCENKVLKAKESIDGINENISQLTTQLNALNPNDSNYQTEKTRIEEEIKREQEKLTEANKNYEVVATEATERLIKVKKNEAEAFKILRNIEQLENPKTPESELDLTEEKETLNKFNEKRENFIKILYDKKDATPQEIQKAADELKAVYEGHTGEPNKTMDTAYNFMKKNYPNYFKAA